MAVDPIARGLAATASEPTATGGNTARSLANRFGDMISAKDFGAVADGVVDDTAALNALFAYTSANAKCAYLPDGTYKITAALTAISANGVCIRGAGPGAAILYAGASTTPGDLLVIGDGTNTYLNADLRGFVIGSSTVLTGGYAVRLKKITNVEIDLIVNGPVSQSGNLYNGIYLDQSSTINLHASRVYVKNYGVVAASGSELHFNHAWIAGSTAGSGRGIYIGGGYGGVYTENLTQQANSVGLYVDTAISASGNTQFFLSPYSTFDSNTSWGASFNDSVSNAISKMIRAEAWFASTSAGGGLAVVNWKDGTLLSGAGVFLNNSGVGLQINDASTRVVLGHAASIAHNGTYGIDASTAVTIYSDAVPNSNTSGSYGANVSIAAITFPVAPTFTVAPDTSWGLDFSGSTLTVANSANAALAAGSGMIVVANPANGDVGLFIVGGGSVNVVSTTGGTWEASTTPAAGHTGIGWNGSAYALYNNYGSSQAFLVSLQRVRASS